MATSVAGMLATTSEIVGVRGAEGGGPKKQTPGMPPQPSQSRSRSAHPRVCKNIKDGCQPLPAGHSPGVRYPQGIILLFFLDQSSRELDGGRGADDSLMVLSSRLEPLGNRVRGWPQLGDLERPQQLALAEEHAYVGPVKLVGRADHEVASPRLDVDELVRREVDGVHERQRLSLVSHGDRPGDIVDGPQGVGCGADGQQLGSMLAQAAVEMVPVELAGLGNHPVLADGDSAVVCKGLPGV